MAFIVRHRLMVTWVRFPTTCTGAAAPAPETLSRWRSDERSQNVKGSLLVRHDLHKQRLGSYSDSLGDMEAAKDYPLQIEFAVFLGSVLAPILCATVAVSEPALQHNSNGEADQLRKSLIRADRTMSCRNNTKDFGRTRCTTAHTFMTSASKPPSLNLPLSICP